MEDLVKNKAAKMVFASLNALNVNDHTEKKNGLTYLSWAWAWQEVKKMFPDAEYKIYKDEQNHPYIEDPDFGLMCFTSVTINGQTHEMWLPVMDGANKAMRRTPYTYKTWDRYNNKWKETGVSAATMFDINKTIMRCLVKNLAMFGLGLYIYAGEDLPADEQQPSQPAQPASPLQPYISAVNGAKTVKEVEDTYRFIIAQNPKLKDDKTLIDMCKVRKQEITNGQH
jgi:hypothetical protein